ncbi:hypothetical protein AX15_005888 [Amanita polypyramis BW_CC]|nr:hypothetical protein AX15_005888 [Amanita polypyramis BW_CC]
MVDDACQGGNSVYSGGPGGSPLEQSACLPQGESSQAPAGFSPQIATQSYHGIDQASENTPTGVNYRYAIPVQHMGVLHLPYSYYGYHHSAHVPDVAHGRPVDYCKTNAQPYPYSSHVIGGVSPIRTSYNTPSMYGRQGVPQSAPAGQGMHVGGAHPPVQYVSYIPFPGFVYRYQNFVHGPPLIYQSHYGSPPFGQHFGPSMEANHPVAWWYVHPGYTGPSQQPFDAGRSAPVHPHPSTLPLSAESCPPQASAHTTPVLSAVQASSVVNSVISLSSSPGTVELASHPPDPGAVEERVPSEKPLLRHSYHPKSPLERSEWVMWAGNVPSDATQDELWQFFKQLPSQDQLETSDATPVVSVFLINRSSCAFVNYDTENHLKEAIWRFNGKALRPNDPRCPKLVCRVRKKDDDLKAGVGGQRGMGLHLKWVREKKAKDQESIPLDPAEDPVVRVMPSHLVCGEEHERRSHPKSNSLGSQTSTTSSVLAQYFPRRYFILKSLTQHDLDLSFQKGLWATQKHNEGVLDQAYRTSQDVFLIFGVNKSGEFYGYARMAGPIQSGGQQVAWETRGTESPSLQECDSTVDEPPLILSPSDRCQIVESPQPTSASIEDDSNLPLLPVADEGLKDMVVTDTCHAHTSPAEIEQRYQKLSAQVPPHHHMYEMANHHRRQAIGMASIRLNPNTLENAITPQEECESEEVRGDDIEKGGGGASWGESFRVEWLCPERLPFYRTRHIRNPWNHDREVKVSRDGTELEPSVGQMLVDEWHALATATDVPQPSSSRSKSKMKITTTGQRSRLGQ